MKAFCKLLILLLISILNNSFAQIDSLSLDKIPALLLGVSSAGGDGFGTVFQTDLDGKNLKVLSTFSPSFPGASPAYAQLFQAKNGKFYGMTSEGGAFNSGVLFEYEEATNSYVKLFDFGGKNGANPSGALVLGSNEKLYGMATAGGATNMGVIFEYDYMTKTYSKKYDFGGKNGANPHGALVLAKNDKFYGMTTRGGTNNAGVLFEYDYTNNNYVKKQDFDSKNGANPYGSLIQAANDKLYGMTFSGGSNGLGVIFEYNYVTNTLLKKIDLESNNGAKPYGDLRQAANDKLYGLTYAGGQQDGGVLFEYDFHSNKYHKLFEFAKGSNPTGSLLLVHGLLYGTSSAGGKQKKGELFEFNYSNNKLRKLQDFEQKNGAAPASLYLAENGKLYGLSAEGGQRDQGVLFEFDIAQNTYRKKFDFGYAFSGNKPFGTLCLARNGKFYGLCAAGGAYDKGTIFEFDYYTKRIVKLYDFIGANGEEPKGTLVQGRNGKLYGLTAAGGVNNAGVLFEFDIQRNTYVKKLDFGGKKGAEPLGNLTPVGTELFYGLCSKGGASNEGVLFEYNYISDSYSKKIDFEAKIGTTPKASLFLHPNAKLYGTCAYTGANNAGTIFEFDPSNNNLSKIHDFEENFGKYPEGTLMLAKNGKLYGTTAKGGQYRSGCLFEYDLEKNLYTKKHHFSISDGSRPIGALTETKSGHLYGMTIEGGSHGQGVLFELNYSKGSFVKILEFDGLSGSFPATGQFLYFQPSNK